MEPVATPEDFTALHQRRVDEALASGPATSLAREAFENTCRRGLDAV